MEWTSFTMLSRIHPLAAQKLAERASVSLLFSVIMILHSHFSMCSLSLDLDFRSLKHDVILDYHILRCGRKCDRDARTEHKHACELGHQIRGMSGVVVEGKQAGSRG